MSILIVRITCFFWAIACLVILVLSYGSTPVTKLSTEMAMTAIEEKYINFASMSDKQRENYNFLSNWVRGNDKGFKNSSMFRHKLILIVTLGSLLICFYIAFFMRNSNKANN